MKVGIMQPYFIPYIGYWQLMNAVDKYVIYDDVNYIKSGWINRNRILSGEGAKYFNIQLVGASSNKKINEIVINRDSRIIGKKMRVIEGAYKKAPFYDKTQPVVEEILLCEEDNLSEYLKKTFDIICNYIGISTEFIFSSKLDKDCELKGQDKVISICRLLGATEYYNAIGGQQIYSYMDFMNHGIKLKFLKTKNIKYVQFDNKFQENLSIIDVLMFNSKERVHQMLYDYSLIETNV